MESAFAILLGKGNVFCHFHSEPQLLAQKHFHRSTVARMLNVETFLRAKCLDEHRPAWKRFLHRFCLRRKISKKGSTWKRFVPVVATWKRFRSPFPKILSFWVLETGQGETHRRGNVSKTFPRRACRPQIVATWKRFQKRFHVGRKRPTWKRFAK